MILDSSILVTKLRNFDKTKYVIKQPNQSNSDLNEIKYDQKELNMVKYG